MSENTLVTNPFDQTDDRTAEESTQENGRNGDVVNTRRPAATPRRNDRHEDPDPARPNDDPALRTEM